MRRITVLATTFCLTMCTMSCRNTPGPEQTPASEKPKPVTWKLWPEEPPGEVEKLEPEYDRSTPASRKVDGRRVTRLTNVSVPTFTIYKPNPAVDTGASMVIAPGGGHNILAYDLEGTEVADWLNSIGVTGIVLKYRVPGRARNPEKKWLASVQDGQRAISLVRGRAEEIGINPGKIGIMGFSAGCSPVKYTALTAKRLYDSVDEYDSVSFQPNFAAPIYSAGPALPEEAELTDECPPFFMVITHDDKQRAIEAAKLYVALKEAGISAELHIYESGGHGYGLRRTEQPVTQWPDRMKEWMRQMKLLERKEDMETSKTDTIETSKGKLKIILIGHGTLMFEFSDKTFHVDPWSKLADYTKMPKADAIFITHEHGDHLDPEAIDTLRKADTRVVGNPAAAEQIPGCATMKNGDTQTILGVKVEAVPAYNIAHTRPSGQPFHPKGRGNGYVMTFGDKRIYVAGDTENIPEMKELSDIHCAFLPMNLPYTMTPEMVADAARTLNPEILYPYHFGNTDTSQLVKLLEDTQIDVRIRKMD